MYKIKRRGDGPEGFKLIINLCAHTLHSQLCYSERKLHATCKIIIFFEQNQLFSKLRNCVQLDAL